MTATITLILICVGFLVALPAFFHAKAQQALREAQAEAAIIQSLCARFESGECIGLRYRIAPQFIRALVFVALSVPWFITLRLSHGEPSSLLLALPLPLAVYYLYRPFSDQPALVVTADALRVGHWTIPWAQMQRARVFHGKYRTELRIDYVQSSARRARMRWKLINVHHFQHETALLRIVQDRLQDRFESK